MQTDLLFQMEEKGMERAKAESGMGRGRKELLHKRFRTIVTELLLLESTAVVSCSETVVLTVASRYTLVSDGRSSATTVCRDNHGYGQSRQEVHYIDSYHAQPSCFNNC